MPSALDRRDFLRGLAGAAAATALRPTAARGDDGRPPNLVVIFADDLGYGDLSCYGSETIRTPNLDRIAAEGVKFTAFYVSASVCSPSRAGLLTGRYQVRVGVPHVLFPGSKIGMPASEITMAEMLKARGYATCCVGKWHLGHLPPFRPTRHGFDQYLGLLYSNDMRPETRPTYPPLELYEGDEVVESPARQEYLTERYTEYATKFIRDHRDRPFFLYLPHTMPHVPLYVSERFAGKSKGGLYGDVVECIDWSAGEILSAIADLGLDENTLVLFTSDNGPWLIKKQHGGSAGPLRNGKGTVFEGGVREPCVARWPGHIPAGSVCHEPAMTIDLFPTFAALSGAELPSDRAIDGVDIRGLLLGSGAPKRTEPLYFFQGKALWALREGKWKLHIRRRRGKRTVELDPPELYDLDADIGETTNLAAEHPDLVARLKDRASAFEAGIRE